MTAYTAATNPAYQRNFGDFQKAAQQVYQRAGRIATVAIDRARSISENRLGAGRIYAFACAHNWQGQAWMTPDQNAAAAEILRLQKRAYRINRIASAMVDNLWAKFDNLQHERMQP